MIKKHLPFAVAILCFMFLLVASTAIADEKQDRKEFDKGPTIEGFLKLKNPTALDLERLHGDSKFSNFGAFKKLGSGEQLKFLTKRYVSIYAEEFVRRASFAEGKSQGDEQKIADIFFEKTVKNVNNNQHSFKRYANSLGIEIVLLGDVTGYTKDGVLSATNGQVNIKKLKDEFMFEVGSDKKLYLRKKGGGELHSFTGRLLLGKQGAKMLGGTFDGKKVEHASRIYFDKNDQVVMKTKRFGSLEFAKTSLVIFKKGKGGQPDTYTIQKNSKVTGIKHLIGGTFSLINDDIKKGFSVSPGKLAYLDGYTIRGINNRVAVKFQKKELKDVKNLQKNVMYVGKENGELVMASAGKRPYEVEFDPGSVIDGQKSIGGFTQFLKVPAKGYSGKKFDVQSQDFMNVMTIQGIVGAETDGRMTGATKKKIKAWQNEYNRRNGFKRGDSRRLKTDGKWKPQESKAYFDELTQSYSLVLKPQGGSGRVALDNGGLDITVQNKFDFEAGPEVYSWQSGQITQRKRFSNAIASAPFTITALDAQGNEVGRVQREGNKNFVSALNKGFVSKELCLPCFMVTRMGMDHLQKDECAGFVHRVSRIEGGWNKKYGFFKETFDRYTGRSGDAWQMSHNVRNKGGESLYWKEEHLGEGDMKLKDPKLGQQVAYDFAKFKEGDVVGIYFTGSGYLVGAKEKGFDGRQNTHVAKVLGKEENVYDFTPREGSSDLKDFVAKKTGVKKAALLATYPVWVKGAGQSDDAFRRVKLKSGQYVYEDTGQPAKVTGESEVMVEKTIIGHLWHKYGKKTDEANIRAVRQEDMAKFFHDDNRFSLYEHMRPNQERLAEAKGNEGTVVAVQIKQETVEQQLGEAGFPNNEIASRSDVIRRENALKNPRPGDVVMVQRGRVVQDDRTADLPLTEALDDAGADDAEEWRQLVTASTHARIDEYDIPEEDAEALELLTLAVGIKESGLTDSFLGYYKAKKKAEDVVAWGGDRTLTPMSIEREAQDHSYGYFQLKPGNAKGNAYDLVKAGKIEDVDYRKLRDLTNKEGAVKHGQRELAKIWKRYVTPDMQRKDKMQMVAAAYNCGQWCPRNAAFQHQFTQLTKVTVNPDGKLGGSSADVFEAYATKIGVPFDRKDMGENFHDSAFFKEVKKRWKEEFKRDPRFGIIPDWNYGQQVMRTCRKISNNCVDT